MKTTDNYGRPVICQVCKKDELKDFKIYFPPHANAIDSVKYAYCEDHEIEVIELYTQVEASKNRRFHYDS